MHSLESDGLVAVRYETFDTVRVCEIWEGPELYLGHGRAF